MGHSDQLPTGRNSYLNWSKVCNLILHLVNWGSVDDLPLFNELTKFMLNRVEYGIATRQNIGQ